MPLQDITLYVETNAAFPDVTAEALEAALLRVGAHDLSVSRIGDKLRIDYVAPALHFDHAVRTVQRWLELTTLPVVVVRTVDLNAGLTVYALRFHTDTSVSTDELGRLLIDAGAESVEIEEVENGTRRINCQMPAIDRTNAIIDARAALRRCVDPAAIFHIESSF